MGYSKHSPVSSTSSSVHPPAVLSASTTRSASHDSKAAKGQRPKTLQRAEARLGVTTDYVDLSLHSASANGNVGLVKYALIHGQPVNSVLNGVLPLHAAASSGNEDVVLMLIEAGADVNSPRLRRRYSNAHTRTSGIAVGTSGSTPLHFAAANGHVNIISILLSFGAKTNIVEKYGRTPEAIARQSGHDDAAALLESWEGDEDDRASSSGTSIRSASKSLRHPQRSFDALALKLSQHASASTCHLPHLNLSSLAHSGSSLSLNQIPHTAPSSTGSFAPRISPSNQHLLETSRRRPSLPSVFEKAAHPAAALKQALALASLRRGSDGAERKQGRSSSLSSHGSSGVWGDAPQDSALEELESFEDVTDPRRRSDTLEGLGRSVSLTTSLAGHQIPSTAPPTKTSFYPREIGTGGFESAAPPARIGRTNSLGSSHAVPGSLKASSNFYRPRQSSQLSGRTTSSGGWAPPSPHVFLDDDEEAGQEQGTDDRPAAVEDPDATVRQRRRTISTVPVSPLATNLHSRSLWSAHERQGSAASSGFSLNSSSRPVSSAGGTPETDSRPTLSNYSDEPPVEFGGSGATGSGAPARNVVGPSSSLPRRSLHLRDRTDSTGSGSSTLSRRPATAPAAHSIHASTSNELLPPPPGRQHIETRSNRSNSAGTDGRFSSSPASSYSGPGGLSTYAPSYAPSNSTVATSVAPSSPMGWSGPPPPPLARQPLLSPLYERHGSKSSESTITSEQASKIVKKAEQDLLAFDAKKGGPDAVRAQLAAYGQILSLERRLKALEGGSATSSVHSAPGSKYVFETIGRDGSRVGEVDGRSKTSSTPSAPPTPPHKHKHAYSHDQPKAVVPQWRAIPPSDRLMPPPSGRRSISPSLSLPPGSSSQVAKRLPSVTVGAPLSHSSLPTALPTTRTSSFSSTSSSTAILPGGSTNGISYVEVVPKLPTKPRTTRPGKAEKSHSNKGGSSVTSSKDQVLLDAAEQARIAAAIPKAELTAKKPSKGGFARRLLSSVKGM